MKRHIEEEEPRLPFPTKPLVIIDVELEEYIIPEDKKAEVLNELYLFDPVPALDAVLYDLHSDKNFVVRDFRVIREDGQNWLVSPYYEEGGGTVIDWVSPEDMCEDDEEEEDF
ncbi:MAG TPA: hypothetical protein VHY08_06935 [Bacillota bacterium]|nr:hypothetical protein [Bacillota bacterium]